MSGTADSKRRFRHISVAGIFFQGGAAAVDTSTIVAALVHGLTGSAFAVGAAAMALPFYILQTQSSAPDVAFLLGAQTAGALFSNPVWGWWGDRRGKRELLEITAALGAVAPLPQ